MSYCHITRFDLMHVTETGPALRHLGQSFPFQQTISTRAPSYLCAVRHATQRSAPGANTRAPTLPPHVITDWEYGGIEYRGLPVTYAVIAMRSNIFRICLCPDSSDICFYGLAQVVTESHLIVTGLIASSG